MTTRDVTIYECNKCNTKVEGRRDEGPEGWWSLSQWSEECCLVMADLCSVACVAGWSDDNEA